MPGLSLLAMNTLAARSEPRKGVNPPRSERFNTRLRIVSSQGSEPKVCLTPIASEIISSNFDNMMRSLDKSAYSLAVPRHQRELFDGLIRIHVLVHASHEPIFGLAMMRELEDHGYRIGPGTLYPLLHGMERVGVLTSAFKNVSGRRRRVYRITPAGRKTLKRARLMVDELHRELHEEHPRPVGQQ